MHACVVYVRYVCMHVLVYVRDRLKLVPLRLVQTERERQIQIHTFSMRDRHRDRDSD